MGFVIFPVAFALVIHAAWGIVVGVAIAALVTLGPWMAMVHAKLSEIAEKLDELKNEAGNERRH